MLVSVHMPKTAGVSFAATLEDNYGSNLLKDYADLPINTPVYERNKAALQASLCNAEKDFLNIECIHGHFLPLKYLLLSDKQKTTFITWMRNPVERLLSHYYYWKRNFNPETAPYLHKKVIEENWSVEQFSLAPELKDLYSQFLYGFPLEKFSFIGISEFYNDDFDFFVRSYLNSSVKPKRLNINSEGGLYPIEASLRNEIERFHFNDMNLYQRALEKRLSRSSFQLTDI
ncbi:MAG: hypothetical protein PHR16_14185 [Methylovulum sp.]|nr:hypothetical protein [Methylovulum sp.]